MFKFILLSLTLSITLISSTFAQVDNPCDFLEQQIIAKENVVAQVDQNLSELVKEVDQTKDEIIELEAKYKRRKMIWIPVSVVAGLAAITSGIVLLQAFRNHEVVGVISSFILVPAGITLGTGSALALRPIKVTKKQLIQLGESLELLQIDLQDLESNLAEQLDSLNGIKAIYELNCKGT